MDNKRLGFAGTVESNGSSSGSSDDDRLNAWQLALAIGLPVLFLVSLCLICASWLIRRHQDSRDFSGKHSAVPRV